MGDKIIRRFDFILFVLCFKAFKPNLNLKTKQNKTKNKNKTFKANVPVTLLLFLKMGFIYKADITSFSEASVTFSSLSYFYEGLVMKRICH